MFRIARQSSRIVKKLNFNCLSRFLSLHSTCSPNIIINPPLVLIANESELQFKIIYFEVVQSWLQVAKYGLNKIKPYHKEIILQFTMSGRDERNRNRNFTHETLAYGQITNCNNLWDSREFYVDWSEFDIVKSSHHKI